MTGDHVVCDAHSIHPWASDTVSAEESLGHRILSRRLVRQEIHTTSFQSNFISAIFASVMKLIAMPVIQSSDVSSQYHLEKAFELDLADSSSGDAKPAVLWYGIEIFCGIICACLAVLRPLLAKIFPQFIQTMSSPPLKHSKSDYERVDTEERRRSIPWEDPELAKTFQAYRAVEINSGSRLGRERTETESPEAGTECYHSSFSRRHHCSDETV